MVRAWVDRTNTAPRTTDFLLKNLRVFVSVLILPRVLRLVRGQVSRLNCATLGRRDCYTR